MWDLCWWWHVTVKVWDQSRVLGQWKHCLHPTLHCVKTILWVSFNYLWVGHDWIAMIFSRFFDSVQMQWSTLLDIQLINSKVGLEKKIEACQQSKVIEFYPKIFSTCWSCCAKTEGGGNSILWTLTFAPILVKVSDSSTVVNERSVIEQEGWRSIRKGPMIKMIESAVVLSAVGRSKIEVRSAQELSFYLTSSLAGSSTVGHQLLVSVEVNIDMQRNLLFRNSDSWTWKWSLILTRTFRVQTQVFKIVNACDKTTKL